MAKRSPHRGGPYPASAGQTEPAAERCGTGIIDSGLPILYRDDWLVAIDKPAGVLSQPGIQVQDSVHSRARQWPGMSGPVLVHRLDMDTSGVMVLARTRDVHRHLQQQFEQRQVAKRYIALLEGPPPGLAGLVDLPLRLDIDNRPWQIVCRSYGRQAMTAWRLDRRDPGGRRVILQPITGRTHQLRVHLAHRAGLDRPIVGDRLYGAGAQPTGSAPGERRAGSRLMLHAEQLHLRHPVTGDALRLVAPMPF